MLLENGQLRQPQRVSAVRPRTSLAHGIHVVQAVHRAAQVGKPCLSAQPPALQVHLAGEDAIQVSAMQRH